MDIEDNFSLVKEEKKEMEDLSLEEKELAMKLANEDVLFERMSSYVVNQVFENNQEKE